MTKGWCVFFTCLTGCLRKKRERLWVRQPLRLFSHLAESPREVSLSPQANNLRHRLTLFTVALQKARLSWPSMVCQASCPL